jgi:hypothetical protein
MDEGWQAEKRSRSPSSRDLSGLKLGRLPTNDFLMRDLYGYLTLGNVVKYGCSYFLLHFRFVRFPDKFGAQ